MHGQLQLPTEVAQTIHRCADALPDLPRLRDELHALRLLSDPYAQFATALFDLERARRGDPEARSAMLELADQLLVFWRAGSGVELARSHPVLEDLWETAASLLASFETKRFAKALKACWNARTEPVLLQVAIRDLLPEGNRRVEFARCLYHLELARQFVDTSRAEFAKRAGLLSEAYQSPEVADLLVGDDPGLRVLWDEVVPYLDEFFEMLEQDAARRQRALQTTPTAPVAAVARRELKTDPELLAAPLIEAEAEDDIEVELPEAMASAPPPPPQAGSDTLDPDVVFEAEEPAGPLAAPPPPSDMTPPGSWFPPGARVPQPPPPPRPSLPTPGPPPMEVDLDDVDLQVEEVAPRRPVRNLDVVLDEPDPDARHQAFWQHSIKALSLLPDPNTPRVVRRLLNSDNRADRKTLTSYLDELEPWLDVDDARAFAALLKLMLAGQLKEKSLFGQVNTRRSEAFAEAFSLLAATPRAAGHGATWFVMDGPETLTALHRGLDGLVRFLAFCAREQKDPLDVAVQKAFVSEVNP